MNRARRQQIETKRQTLNSLWNSIFKSIEEKKTPVRKKYIFDEIKSSDNDFQFYHSSLKSMRNRKKISFEKKNADLMNYGFVLKQTKKIVERARMHLVCLIDQSPSNTGHCNNGG